MAVALAVAVIAATGVLAPTAAFAVPNHAAPAPIPRGFLGSNPITKQACNNNASAHAATGFVRDHFAWCSWWNESPKLRDSKGRILWAGSFRVTMVASGYMGSRQYRQTIFLDRIMPADPTVSVGVNPTCYGCTSQPQQVTRNLLQWSNPRSNSVSFLLEVPTTGSYGKELKKTVVLGAAFAVMGRGGVATAWPTENTEVRCDSAQYFYADRRAGCIFTRVQAVLPMSHVDPTYGQSATFIARAIANPSASIPRVAGKVLRGGWKSNTELHRQQPPGSRARVYGACRNEWGVNYAKGDARSPKGYQCDEYPFASTAEGAHSGTNDFAVMRLPASQNSIGGTRIGVWYQNDRILDGDGFQVRIF